ncbi:MAG: hypothetical protein ACXQS8_08305 [Candidatus Helarchaeales archaeon]
MLQKTYVNNTKQLDNDLFSGFITAIFNFSKEISDFDESLHSISMGRVRFFYRSTEAIIVVVSADKRINESQIEPIMDRIISEFQEKGFEKLVAKRVQEIQVFEKFSNNLDRIITDAEEMLQATIIEEEPIQERKSKLKARSPILKAVQADAQTKSEMAELQALRDGVVEALENAEHALTQGDLQGSIIYYGVAAGIFQRLGDFEKAKLCNKMVNQAKEALSRQEARVICTFDENLTPIIQEISPILPLEMINDLQLKETLQQAFHSELDRNYGEAIAFYNSAASRFLELNENELAEKCQDRIQEIFKRQQYEEKAAIAAIGGDTNTQEITTITSKETSPTPSKVKLLIPEERIPDEDIKSLLMNAALSESINAIEKAVSFYTEAINKFRFYEDEQNAALCQKKIEELQQIIDIQKQIEEITSGKEIFPFDQIAEPKILQHLKSAQELERQYKFSQAALKYNLASGMLSLKKDKKLKKFARLCTERAKILTRLKEYVQTG